MSALQLGLIVAGVVLVIAVLIYNSWQERRVRRGIQSAFDPSNSVRSEAEPAASGRVEPTFRGTGVASPTDRANPAHNIPPASGVAAYRPPADQEDAAAWSPPIEVIEHTPPAEIDGAVVALSPEGRAPVPIAHPSEGEAGIARRPDADIECIVTLQPARPVSAGALAAGLHARLGKRLRWFGRIAPDAPWQLLGPATGGEFVELAACMLLADRNGAASRAQLDTFARVMAELAPLLPAAISVPDVGAEADRAEALDHLCADVDVQIGLTILKQENGIPGTKLRGVAEAAGFRLASGGRFEWVQEDSGAVHYTLQNIRNEPFTVDTLRLSATNGVVFVLDVPRVADAVRVFDHMKLAAKRLAHSLSAELVDDNRRPLDDAALTAIRKQVEAASAALRECGIEPGSPRALALFGA